MRAKALLLAAILATIDIAPGVAAREAPDAAAVRPAAVRGSPRMGHGVARRGRGRIARLGHGRAARRPVFRPGFVGAGLGSVAGIGFGSVVANGGGYPGGYTGAFYGGCGYGFAGPLPVSCDGYPY